MTRFITYKCSLCPKSLDPKVATGFALKWVGGGQQTLDCTRWDEAPIHLCTDCILAIQKFAVEHLGDERK